MDAGYLDDLKCLEAPQMAKDYYELPENASFRDMVLAIRADESIHREVNHYLTELGPKEQVEAFSCDYDAKASIKV